MKFGEIQKKSQNVKDKFWLGMASPGMICSLGAPDLTEWLWAVSKKVGCSFNRHYGLSGPVLGSLGNKTQTSLPSGLFIALVRTDRHTQSQVSGRGFKGDNTVEKTNLSRIRGARSPGLGDWETE